MPLNPPTSVEFGSFIQNSVRVENTNQLQSPVTNQTEAISLYLCKAVVNQVILVQCKVASDLKGWAEGKWWEEWFRFVCKNILLLF